MHEDEVSFGDVQRGQQLLKQNIAESHRLIDETQQRVETSRALVGLNGKPARQEEEREPG
jgi:hypothetical protein